MSDTAVLLMRFPRGACVDDDVMQRRVTHGRAVAVSGQQRR